jgi:hypothetical protein
MKIVLTKNLGGHKAGETIDVSDAIAERLIAREVAEKPKPARKTD